MTGFARTVLLLLLTAGAASADAQSATPGAETMDVTRKADMKTMDGPAEWFTGKVSITAQFQRSEPSRVGYTEYLAGPTKD